MKILTPFFEKWYVANIDCVYVGNISRPSRAKNFSEAIQVGSKNNHPDFIYHFLFLQQTIVVLVSFVEWLLQLTEIFYAQLELLFKVLISRS